MEVLEEAQYLELEGSVEGSEHTLPEEECLSSTKGEQRYTPICGRSFRTYDDLIISPTNNSNPSLEDHETDPKTILSPSNQINVEEECSKINFYSSGDEYLLEKLDKDKAVKKPGDVCTDKTMKLDKSSDCGYVPVRRSELNKTGTEFYITPLPLSLPLGQSENTSIEDKCFPCQNEGKIITANAYCETCGEDLCDNCFKVHRIPTPMKNHVLKYKTKTFQAVSESKSKTGQCSVACPTHKSKCIEFFCLIHDATVCGTCAVLDHKSCNVKLIADVAKGYKESFEFKALLQSLEKLDVNVTKIDDQKSIDVIENTTADVLDDIRKARNDLNAYCDKAESELTEAITSMMTRDKAATESNLEKKNLLKADINEARCKLLSQNQEDLFVTAKHVNRQMTRFHETYAEFLRISKAPNYSFTRGSFFDDILKSRHPFGSVISAYKEASESYEDLESKYMVEETYATVKNAGLETETVTKCPDISVAHKSDTKGTWVTGIAVLPNNTVLVVDRNNLSVKKVENKAVSVSESLALLSEPWDITEMPGDKAAVTLSNEKKVIILSVKRHMKILKKLKVNGKCHGIDSTDDKLVISFTKPPKVEVIDQKGNVINSYSADELGKNLFVSPNYASVSNENLDSMYLSDFDRNTVTKLSLTGKVISKHSFKEWNGLFGIAVAEDEQILVCNYWNDSIDVVSKSGKRHVLLDPCHGIEKPRSLHYCSTRKLLLVCANVENASVTVFQFH